MRDENYWVGKWREALERADDFKAGQPFPNIVLDNFLPPVLANLALHAFPPIDSDVWRFAGNEHTARKGVVAYGEYQCKELQFSPEAMAVFYFLMGCPMIKYLEALTGIAGLVPDPHFVEGGFHVVGTGGRLGIHADFSHHARTGLERRLNLLLYLNPDWCPEYGGELGLYDEQLNRVVKVEPVHNRAVIFATSDSSYHGHPEPMSAPDTFLRRSIALYYYTLPRAERARRMIQFPGDPEFYHPGKDAKPHA